MFFSVIGAIQMRYDDDDDEGTVLGPRNNYFQQCFNGVSRRSHGTVT